MAFAASMALIGAVVGSFIGAQVWRLRAQQLIEDKAAGEAVDTAELKRLKSLIGQRLSSDRSRCLSCNHGLAWYDLLPIASWLAGSGRCRYCKAPIGWMEIGLEAGLAVLFAAVVYHRDILFSGALPSVQLALFLAAIALLAFLFVYDLRWYLLPDVVVWPFVAISAIFAFLKVAGGEESDGWLSLVMSVMILSGIYLALYIISKGKWIGFGDVKLNLGLALFLVDWRLALLTLFTANLLGTLIVLPGMIRGTVSRGAHIPFGPLLILGFLLVWFFGQPIVDWLFVL